MKFLVANLNFIIGDLVLKNNQTWKTYLSVRKLLFLILSPSMNHNMIEDLNTHISNHLKMYKYLVQKPFKPKQHHSTHYPEMIKNLDIPRIVSSIRYEGKHKQLKDACKLVASRVNVSKTILKKHQLQLNYRFLQRKGLNIEIKKGQVLCKEVSFFKHHKLFGKKLSDNQKKSYKPISFININSACFRENSIILINHSATNIEFG